MLAALPIDSWFLRMTSRRTERPLESSRSPTEIICMGLIVLFWAELQAVEDGATLEAGGEALKAAALMFHPPEAPTEDTGMVLLR